MNNKQKVKMERARLILLLLFALLFCGENPTARVIEHLVVNEKIDRVGSLQNGGSGETLFAKSSSNLKKESCFSFSAGDTGSKLQKEIMNSFNSDQFFEQKPDLDELYKDGNNFELNYDYGFE